MFKFGYINGKKILVSDLSHIHKVLFTTRESAITHKDLLEIKEDCEKNIKDISEYLEIDTDSIISPEQTHSANIKIANKITQYGDTDALVIDRTDIAIALNFADCTPIVLIDTYNNIGAIVHAGWKGTAKSITTKTIEFLKNNYKTNINDVIGIIGPAISMNNYQVDYDVFRQLKDTLKKDYEDYWKYDKKTDKYNVDLKLINQHQMTELGMDIRRIDKCDFCTYDSNDIFFSYRKENGITARHSAILKLAETIQD